MDPAIYNFSLYAGASFEISFLRKDDAGNVIDFTGYTPRFTAKKKLSDTEPVIQITGTAKLQFNDDGYLVLKLDAEDTDIDPCCLLYAISMISDTDPDTDILAYFDGKITVVKRADTP